MSTRDDEDSDEKGEELGDIKQYFQSRRPQRSSDGAPPEPKPETPQVKRSEPVIGFIGLGTMGAPMAKNILKGGKPMIVWSRNSRKAQAFAEANNCEYANTPKEVARKADVVFAMLSTPQAALDVYFERDGLLESWGARKSLIDCSTYEAQDMQRIQLAVEEKGGYFMEAPVSGSKGPAETGQLIFMCAGSPNVFKLVQKELGLMGKKGVFLGGEVGKATQMKLIVNAMMSTMLASFAEGLKLAQDLDLDEDALMEVVNNGAIAAPMFKLKAPMMQKRNYPPAFPLEYALKDLDFSLSLAEEHAGVMPLATIAAALYRKVAARHGTKDFSAIYEATKSVPGDDFYSYLIRALLNVPK